MTDPRLCSVRAERIARLIDRRVFNFVDDFPIVKKPTPFQARIMEEVIATAALTRMRGDLNRIANVSEDVVDLVVAHLDKISDEHYETYGIERK